MHKVLPWLNQTNVKWNHVVSICKEDGTRTQFQQEGAAEFAIYYEKLLGSQVIYEPFEQQVVTSGPKIIGEQAKLLAKPFTKGIKLALFNIDDDKSLGLNGFTSYFFKQAWELVGLHFTDAVMV